MKNIHLICNAHLDPVWQWDVEEGLFEALSTFRIAADFCEEFPGFVFNHNEAFLYDGIRRLDPPLFERIQKLVAAGKWHIMGGWYLQPDCNMPSGEAMVRQALLGRRFFDAHFHVRPTCAVNFDPFGHSRGLVQILAKCGYNAYMFCRPGEEDIHLPAGAFTWEGYDGSTVTAGRADGHYNNMVGEAAKKITEWTEKYRDRTSCFILWGMGNHGGGAYRKDLEDVTRLMGEEPALRHSRPEDYFADMRDKPLESVSSGLNSWAPGCYTAQIRIKQKYRQLEDLLISTETTATHAWACGLMEYPARELMEAQQDMAYCQFHDILGGTCTSQVEDDCLAWLDHAIRILREVRLRAFNALTKGQPRGGEGEIPVLAYNPHPYPLERVWECEVQLQTINYDDTTVTLPEVWQDGKCLPYQLEQERGSVAVDWRKKVTFRAVLPAGTMSRFDVKPRRVSLPLDKPGLPREGEHLIFDNGEMRVAINTVTGLVDSYTVAGKEYLARDAFQPIVMMDDDDPWGSTRSRYTDMEGPFSLLTGEALTRFCGSPRGTLEGVRVIEKGCVRTVVEASFFRGDNRINQRYILPQKGTAFRVETTVFWNEKSRMLKLSIPTALSHGEYWGQTMYGRERLYEDGKECVAQRWVMVQQGNSALSVVNNGTYGSDYTHGRIHLTLLKSSAYAALFVGKRWLCPEDRFVPRMEQGERTFAFEVNASACGERLQAVEREAQAFGEAPWVTACYPASPGEKPMPLISLSDPAVTVGALKKAEDSDGIILRLFEPTGQARTCEVTLLSHRFTVELAPYEIKTLCITQGDVRETNLLEESI